MTLMTNLAHSIFFVNPSMSNFFGYATVITEFSLGINLMNQFPPVITELHFSLNQGGQFTAIADDTPALREWLGHGNMGEQTLYCLLGIYDVTWGKIGKDPEGSGQINLTFIPHILDEVEE